MQLGEFIFAGVLGSAAVMIIPATIYAIAEFYEKHEEKKDWQSANHRSIYSALGNHVFDLITKRAGER